MIKAYLLVKTSSSKTVIKQNNRDTALLNRNIGKSFLTSDHVASLGTGGRHYSKRIHFRSLLRAEVESYLLLF